MDFFIGKKYTGSNSPIIPSLCVFSACSSYETAVTSIVLTISTTIGCCVFSLFTMVHEEQIPNDSNKKELKKCFFIFTPFMTFFLYFNKISQKVKQKLAIFF